MKRQILDQYLKNISNITSHYGISTIEIASEKTKSQKPPNTSRRYKYRILKSFYRLYKKYTTQKVTKSKFHIHIRCILKYL